MCTDPIRGFEMSARGTVEQPVTIQLQWSSTPEWLPSVTVNQLNLTSTDRAEEIRLIDGQTRRLK